MTQQLIFTPTSDAESEDVAGWLIYHELVAPREVLTHEEYNELIDAVCVLEVGGAAWDDVIKTWAGRVSRPMKKGA